MGWIIAFSVSLTLLIVVSIAFIFFYKSSKSKNNETSENQNDNNQKITESLSSLSSNTGREFQLLREQLKDLTSNTIPIKSVEESVNNLNKIFLNNQLRGRAGEFALQTLLDDLFGQNSDIVKYQTSLPVENNKSNTGIVDASIKLDSKNNQFIVIDSKFPIDNYFKLIEAKDKDIVEIAKKDLRENVIQKFNECSKYVNSPCVTYVILYIPSDSIYQKVVEIMGSELPSIIRNKKVWIVSPTTLYPLLSIIVTLNDQIKRSRNVKQIMENLQAFQTEFTRFDERWKDLIKKTQSQNKSIDDLSKTVDKINSKFQKITSSNFNKKLDLLDSEKQVNEIDSEVKNVDFVDE